MSAATIIPSLIPLFVAIALRRAEDRVLRRFTDSGAVSAQTAIPLELSRHFEQRRLEGLLRSGAVQRTADNRLFLDADGLNRHREARHTRVIFGLCVVVALLGVAWAAFLAAR